MTTIECIQDPEIGSCPLLQKGRQVKGEQKFKKIKSIGVLLVQIGHQFLT